MLTPANMKRAYQRVVSNKGAPGNDLSLSFPGSLGGLNRGGMSVDPNNQFILISAGGGRQSPDCGDYVIAYALPESK